MEKQKEENMEKESIFSEEKEKEANIMEREKLLRTDGRADEWTGTEALEEVPADQKSKGTDSGLLLTRHNSQDLTSLGLERKAFLCFWSDM